MFALGLRHPSYTNLCTVWRNEKCTLSPILRKMKCGANESGISFKSNIESNILEISKTNRISNRLRIFSGFKFD